ncbi:MAG: ABC transporter ATP-binding protein [Pseudomonadota bacterium]
MTYRSSLRAKEATVRFPGASVLDKLSIDIPDDKLTVIIGRNGSGKSTLLRSLSRLQKLNAGQIVLDGKPLKKLKNRMIARRLAVLPQGLSPPDGITVRELVSRGRTPYQTAFRQWSQSDDMAITDALAKTGLSDDAERTVSTLSGGQQQRVWIAMILAQDTKLLLLDEPTTFLYLRHQIEVLNLIRDLVSAHSRTVVAVLHDINLAARFADHIIALDGGQIHSVGKPDDVITAQSMAAVFDLDVEIIQDPIHKKPHIIPR